MSACDAEPFSLAMCVHIIGDKPFCVWPEFESRAAPFGNSSVFEPATVVQWSKNCFTSDDLSEVCRRFAAEDDIWDSNFLKFVVLRASKIIDVNCNAHGVTIIVADDTTFNFPDGPSLLQPVTGKVLAIASLVEDTNEAFIGGAVVRHPGSNKFHWLYSNRIAIPSRLYYTKSESKPLAGARFAVKDVIDVAGLETGCGNRSYRRLYPPARVSAPFINQLLKAGAVLVGKTACAEFCDGQDPCERFQYITPFNPRGDGFQAPSSSSSGSAVACATYEWLDFTIGTDTGGSIRHPAGVNGVYGMRPSKGFVESAGLVVTHLMDTTGAFTRSAAMLELVSNCMTTPSLKGKLGLPTRPRFKLLYPVRNGTAKPSDPPKWFPRPGTTGSQVEAEAMLEKTVQMIERHLDCKRHIFCVEELWNSTRQQEQPELNKLTNAIYPEIVYSSLARNAILPFMKKYREAKSGCPPFLEPLFRRRIEYGEQVTDAQYDTAVQLYEMFSDWVRNVLFSTTSPDEIPLLVYPQSWGTPYYRDVTRDSDSALFWSGFSVYSFSYCSGCPDITIPLGEVEYESKVINRKEFLPVSLSVLARPGMDEVLLQMLRSWEDHGILRAVSTGHSLYPA